MTTIRLARFLARAGVTSRRGAADLVRAGRVAINGAPPRGPGDPVDPERDRVTLDGRRLGMPVEAWFALNKPPGYVTSRLASARFPTVFDLLPGASRSFVSVGRLDVLSEGLLLFTTDGVLAGRLMHPRWQVPRTYRVWVTGRPRITEREALARGVPVEGGEPVRPSAWRFLPDAKGGRLEVRLGEGRSRIVRRMAASLGLGVRRLVRIGYGPITLGTLGPGRSRPLRPGEVEALYGVAGLGAPAPVPSRSSREA